MPVPFPLPAWGNGGVLDTDMNTRVNDPLNELDARLDRIGVSVDSTNINHGYGAWANKPASPATGWTYFDTGRGMEFFWDGTRWLSTQLIPMDFGPERGGYMTADGIVTRLNVPLATSESIWIVRFSYSTRVASSNDASNYWRLRLYWENGTGVGTALPGFTPTPPNTSADALAFVAGNLNINSQLDDTAVFLYYHVEKVGSAGWLTTAGTLFYRVMGG